MRSSSLSGVHWVVAKIGVTTKSTTGNGLRMRLLPGRISISNGRAMRRMA
jgi:hypothetical protein